MTEIDACLHLLRSRRSIRRFRAEPISRDTISSLIEAAGWSPSASNRQSWEFAIVQSQTQKEAMAEACRNAWQSTLKGAPESLTEELKAYGQNFQWFSSAPVVVVVSSKKADGFLVSHLGDKAETVSGGIASAAMASQNLMLAATAMGLGSCCLTGPLVAEEELKRIVGLGQRRQIVCLIALGYAAEVPQNPGRKDIDEIVRYIE